MMQKDELAQKGFIPPKGYAIGAAFPPGFQVPEKIKNEDRVRLPLYLNVLYTEERSLDGYHYRKF